jgi:hypothetical protein
VLCPCYHGFISKSMHQWRRNHGGSRVENSGCGCSLRMRVEPPFVRKSSYATDHRYTSLSQLLFVVTFGTATIYFFTCDVSNTFGTFNNPLDAMGISLNKHKLMYDILTPSIIAPYKFLWTYGGSGHIYVSVAG